MTSPVLIPISPAASRSAAVATTALPKMLRRLNSSTASISTMAPKTITSSIGSTRTPPTSIGASGNGEGNFRASRPQMFSATFLKMMPSAMVAMIQPASDLIAIARRTPSRSTTPPWMSPKTSTTGSIAQ